MGDGRDDETEAFRGWRVMESSEIASVVLAVLTTIGTLGGLMIFMFSKLYSDVKILSARTDRLYEMFIDLLKERR